MSVAVVVVVVGRTLIFIVNIEGEQARLHPFNGRSRNMTLTKSDFIASNTMDNGVYNIEAEVSIHCTSSKGCWW